MKSNVLKFTTFFEGWSPAFEVFPIIANSDLNQIVGGFTVIEGPVWKCFIARTGYQESILVTENKGYATPQRDVTGAITTILLSDWAINEESKIVIINE